MMALRKVSLIPNDQEVLLFVRRGDKIQQNANHSPNPQQVSK